MLSKINRFHGHNSLNFVYKNGKTTRTECMSLRYAPARNADYRLAIVVSKKVNKSAVVRNRIRRRIYEAMRLAAQDWKHDMVISVFDDSLAEIPFNQLDASLKQMLKKAGI